MKKHLRHVSAFMALNFIFFSCLTAYAQVPTRANQGVTTKPSFRTYRDDGAASQPSGLGGERSGFPQQGLSDYSRSGLGSGVISMSAYQIHVLGEVGKPGTYQVSASTRLSDAVKQAGDVASAGSLRHIQLKRDGRSIPIDLLSYEIYGDLANNPYLVENDVIFVPLRKDVVQIAGSVRRPNTYELKNERNLKSLIELAGDFTAGVDISIPIKVVRFKNGNKNVIDVNNDSVSLSSFDILNGDVVFIPNVITAQNEFDFNVESLPGEQPFYPSYEDRVFVLGGVKFPGAYPFSPHYNLSQYLSLAGGVSERGKVNKIKIIAPDGTIRKGVDGMVVNPGDSISVKERWLSPTGWITFMVSIASFGLSASATILALQRK